LKKKIVPFLGLDNSFELFSNNDQQMDEQEETALVLRMMNKNDGLELKKNRKPKLLKNRQVFDLDSELSDFNPFDDPLTLDLAQNRAERNSCCHADEKSDLGLDSTQSISVYEGDIVTKKRQPPKSRKDNTSFNCSLFLVNKR
jgi:hypothetical protein